MRNSNNDSENIISEKSNSISLAEKYFMDAEEYRFNNKFKESIQSYLNSILIKRENITPYIGLAISYQKLKNYKKAISILKKAEQLYPNDVIVQKELALCNIINGEFDEGIKHLRLAIRIEPDNVDIQMQLALVHEMIEEEDLALMIYQKIIETNPEFIRAYIQKATLYMHLDDYLNSAKVFKTVIKLKPDYYRSYLALGICYEKLGNLQTAKRYYKKYLRLCNKNTSYKDVLLRVNELEYNNKNKKHNLRIV